MSRDQHDHSTADGEEKIRERIGKAPDASLPGVMACNVQSKQLRWLWPGYLPLGMFCGLEGDPGEGKSLIAIDIAARITAGADFPDGAKCSPGNVILISGEDDEAVTLRPRLEASGADLSRVRLWTKGLPTLPGDTDKLLNVIKADHIRLVILDPMDCLYGEKTDPNSNPSVRRVLHPLAEGASALQCTIWAIRHLNKDLKVGKAIYRGSGSIGFAGQSRAVFLANPTREDPDLRAFARVKGNLSKRPPTLCYRIVEAAIPGAGGEEIKTQRIEWTGSINASADDLLGEPESGRRGPSPEKREAAEAFLREVLADEAPHPSKPIIEAAKKRGIGYRTLMDAADALFVLRRKRDFSDGWYWALPGTPNNSASSTNTHGQKDFNEDAALLGNSATSQGSQNQIDEFDHSTLPNWGSRGLFGSKEKSSPSSDENPEDAEFQIDKSATSTDSFSPNGSGDSSVSENAEGAEFLGSRDDADWF